MRETLPVAAAGVGCFDATRREDGTRRPAARLARPLPDPRDVHLPDLELAGRHAARRGRRPRALRRAVVDPRRAGMGRGVVGPARRHRRPGGAAARRAARLGLDAALDHAGDRGRPVGARTSTAARLKVVTTDLHFPSILYLLERWCGERGATLEIARRRPGQWASRSTACSKRSTTRPRWWRCRTSSSPAPGSTTRRALARRCRETGAFLVLDVFQSAGVLPLALRDWGVDAAVGGCLKWLCGGPGNCFLYVDPDRAATLEPAAHRLGRAPGSIRLRAAADPLATGRGPLRQRHAAGAGALRRARRPRHPRRDRSRARCARSRSA